MFSVQQPQVNEFQIWMDIANCGLLNRAWPTVTQVQRGSSSSGDMAVEGNPLGVVQLISARGILLILTWDSSCEVISRHSAPSVFTDRWVRHGLLPLWPQRPHMVSCILVYKSIVTFMYQMWEKLKLISYWGGAGVAFLVRSSFESMHIVVICTTP